MDIVEWVVSALGRRLGVEGQSWRKGLGSARSFSGLESWLQQAGEQRER